MNHPDTVTDVTAKSEAVTAETQQPAATPVVETPAQPQNPSTSIPMILVPFGIVSMISSHLGAMPWDNVEARHIRNAVREVFKSNNVNLASATQPANLEMPTQLFDAASTFLSKLPNDTVEVVMSHIEQFIQSIHQKNKEIQEEAERQALMKKLQEATGTNDTSQ